MAIRNPLEEARLRKLKSTPPSSSTAKDAGWVDWPTGGSRQTGGQPYDPDIARTMKKKHKLIIDEITKQYTGGGGYLSEDWWALPMQEKAGLLDKTQLLTREWYKGQTGVDYPVYPGEQIPWQPVPSSINQLFYSPDQAGVGPEAPGAPPTQPASQFPPPLREGFFPYPPTSELFDEMMRRRQEAAVERGAILPGETLETDQITQDLYLAAINNAIARGAPYQWMLDILEAEDADIAIDEQTLADLLASLGIGAEPAEAPPPSPVVFTSPDGWQTLEDGTRVSPGGIRITPEQFYNMELMGLPPLSPGEEAEAKITEARLGYGPPLTQEEIMATYFPDVQVAPFGVPASMIPAGMIPFDEVGAFIEQQMELRGDRLAIVKDLLGQVFPAEDVDKFLRYIEKQSLSFFADLKRIGRNDATESLVVALYPSATENDIRYIFGQSQVLSYDEWAEWMEGGIIKTPINEAEYQKYITGVDEMGFVSRSVSSGFGSLAASIAGGLRWLGADGVADMIDKEANIYLKLAVPDFSPGELTWMDIYTGVLQAAPSTLTLLATGVLTFGATTAVAGAVGLGRIGTYIASAVVGGGSMRALESAMEAGGVYDAALAQGMTPSEASDAAQQTFLKNLQLVGVDILQIAAFFAPGLRVLNSLAARGLVNMARNVAGQVVFQGFTEAGEELYQDIIQREALGQPIAWDDQMKLVTIIGGIMGAGFGGGSVLYNAVLNKTVDNLSPDLQTTVKVAIRDKIDSGTEETQAKTEALNEAAKTNEKEIKQAAEPAVEEQGIDEYEKAIVGEEVTGELATRINVAESILAEKGILVGRLARQISDMVKKGVSESEIAPIRAELEEAKSRFNKAEKAYGELVGEEPADIKELRRKADEMGRRNIELLDELSRLRATKPKTQEILDRIEVVDKEQREQQRQLNALIDQINKLTTPSAIAARLKPSRLTSAERIAWQEPFAKQREALKPTEEIAKEAKPKAKTAEDIKLEVEKGRRGESVGAMRWDEFHRNPSETEQAIREQLVDFIEQKVPRDIQHKLLREVARAKNFNDLDRVIKKANKLTENFRSKEYKDWLRKEGFRDTSKLEEPTPDATPVEKLVRLIRDAVPARLETEQLKHEALSKKVAMYAQMLKSNSGMAAFQNAKKALGGALPSVDLVLDMERAGMTTEDVDALFDQIAESSLRPFQMLNTSEALMKLLTGSLPTQGELVRLENMFGKELAEAIMRHRGLGQRIWWETISLLNLPRAVLASIDLSFPLRQGALLFWGQPVQALGMFKPMVQAAFRGEAAKVIDNAYRTSRFANLREDAGLDLPPITLADYRLGEGEEAFMTKWAERIPGVAWSQRAFIVGGNQLRTSVFDYWASKWENRPDITMKDYRALASMINDFTGRGKLPSGLSGWAPILNAAFFSPRLQIGRIKAPTHLFSKSKAVRMVAARNITAFLVANMMMIGLAMLAGARVEWDTRSADFGKIRFKNTRIDYWAGFQQYARFIANMVTGEQITTGTGRLYQIDQLTTFGRFMRSKLAPVPGLVLDLLQGETYLGEEFEGMPSNEAWLQVKNRIVPMFIQDLIDAMVEQGLTGAIIAFPAFLGASAQTYNSADWNELSSKLGLPIRDEDYPYSIEETEIYTTKKLYQDMIAKLSDLTVEQMTQNAHLFNAMVFAVAETRELKKEANLIPNKDLWTINADANLGDTYEQYYAQWREVRRINSDPKTLEQFIKDNDGQTPEQVYPNYELGNMTQRQFALLEEYHSLPEEQRASFVEAHPELQNPREAWLKGHPEENAKLALFGQAKILSRKAYDKLKSMMMELDIPDIAIEGIGVPPDELVDDYFDYLGLDVTAGSREGKWFRDQHPEFNDWLEEDRSLQPLAINAQSLEIQMKYATQYKEYELYGDPSSPLFIFDQSTRNRARELYLKENPEFRKARWLEQAYGKDFPETLLANYVTYKEITFQYGSGSKASLYRTSNPAFDAYYSFVFGTKPRTKTALELLKRLLEEK